MARTFTDRLAARKAAQGTQDFGACPCTEDGSPFYPVVLHDAGTFDGALIVALACSTCGAETPVINGRLQPTET